MLIDMDRNFLTDCFGKKIIVKVRPFSSAKTENMHGYFTNLLKGNFIQTF